MELKNIERLIIENSQTASKLEREYEKLTTSDGLYHFLKNIVDYHVSRNSAPPMYKTEKTNDALTTIKIAYKRLMMDYNKGE